MELEYYKNTHGNSINLRGIGKRIVFVECPFGNLDSGPDGRMILARLGTTMDASHPDEHPRIT
jgi:hypothetical protein